MAQKSIFEGTVEITTNILEKGCAVACSICPQDLLSNKYQKQNIRHLSFEDFVNILHKIPKTYRVDFSGYAEPFLNKNCSKMIKYTSDAGYFFCCYTTLVGASLEDVELLSTLNFSREKKCPLHIHLPDKEGVMPVKITEKYKQVLKCLFEKKLSFVDFMTMDHAGEVHPQIKELLGLKLDAFQPISRGNNLDDGENMVEGQALNVKRVNGSIYCKAMPKLNHNVVLPNGDVQLCCMDYGLKHKIGNLIESNHSDLFVSDEFIRVNKLMKNDLGENDNEILCRTCEMAKIRS